MFHSENNLYFERQPDGSVRILKRAIGSSIDPEKIKPGMTGIIMDQTISAETFASAVCNCSFKGETGARFQKIVTFLEESKGNEIDINANQDQESAEKEESHDMEESAGDHLRRVLKDQGKKDGMLRCFLELLLAIELIEYHNKNWLPGWAIENPKRFSEEKQWILEQAVKVIGSSSRCVQT